MAKKSRSNIQKQRLRKCYAAKLDPHLCTKSQKECVYIEDLTNDEESQTVYAHISNLNKVVFDCKDEEETDFTEEGDEDEKEVYRFKVGVFDETYTRICSSLVCIGGGEAHWVDPEPDESEG